MVHPFLDQQSVCLLPLRESRRPSEALNQARKCVLINIHPGGPHLLEHVEWGGTPPPAIDDVSLEQGVPRGDARGRFVEHLAGVLEGPAGGVGLDEPLLYELVGVKGVDAEVGVELVDIGETAGAGGGGEEGGEGGGVDGNAAVVEVVEDGEGFGDFVEVGEAADVAVDGVGVLGVKREGLREGVGFGEFFGLGEGFGWVWGEVGG